MHWAAILDLVQKGLNGIPVKLHTGKHYNMYSIL